MFVTFFTGVANFGELARMAGHAVAKLLVAGVFYVTSTCFVARITYVLFCHSTRYFCDHMKMSHSIVVVLVDMFGRVDFIKQLSYSPENVLGNG